MRRGEQNPERLARWENIEQAVRAFQQGNAEAALDILEAMQPYLLKYLRIVRQAHVNWKDPDARRFISLLLPDPELRRAILRSRNTGTQRARAMYFLRMLVSALRPVPQADLEQEMKAILLELARRYKPMPHKNFVGYVAGRRGAFKYALFRSLKTMVADPTVFQAFTGGATAFDEHCHAPVYDDPAEAFEGELGTGWVRGETAGFPFDRLSPEMRLALKLRFEQGLSENEAATAMGLRVRELRALVNQARSLLEDARRTPPSPGCGSTAAAPATGADVPTQDPQALPKEPQAAPPA